MSYHSRTTRSIAHNIRPGVIQGIHPHNALVIDDSGGVSAPFGQGELIRLRGVPYVDGRGNPGLQNDQTAHFVDAD